MTTISIGDYVRAVHPEPEWWVRQSPPVLSEAAYQRVKRGMDLLIAAILLPLVLPLLAICMVAIKIDSPGPVLFRQMRTGKGGRRFTIFKLRTMVQNAEQIKQQLKHMNVTVWPDFALELDPRITRAGRLLRRTSLDELPQIFNVLRGDMSFVGPRPTSWSADKYTAWHNARLEVLPGITGLAQISGRCGVEFNARRRLDIASVRNRCLRLDIRILVRTVMCVITGEGV